MDVISLQAVIGANCRRIRTEHGVTQAQLASHARRIGLPWTASKVGDFESGRNRVYLDVMYMAFLALDSAIRQGPGPATGHPGPRGRRQRVAMADLVTSDGYVALSPDFAPTGEALAAVSGQKPWELHGGDTAETADVDELLADAPGVLGERYGMRVGQVDDMRRRSTRAETRLADRLGIDADHLLGLSWRVFKGRTYSEERDLRAGPDRASTRLVAQALTTELQAELWKEQQHGDN